MKLPRNAASESAVLATVTTVLELDLACPHRLFGHTQRLSSYLGPLRWSSVKGTLAAYATGRT